MGDEVQALQAQRIKELSNELQNDREIRDATRTFIAGLGDISTNEIKDALEKQNEVMRSCDLNKMISYSTPWDKSKIQIAAILSENNNMKKDLIMKEIEAVRIGGKSVAITDDIVGKLDAIDAQIANALIIDNGKSYVDIAEEVGLSIVDVQNRIIENPALQKYINNIQEKYRPLEDIQSYRINKVIDQKVEKIMMNNLDSMTPFQQMKLIGMYKEFGAKRRNDNSPVVVNVQNNVNSGNTNQSFSMSEPMKQEMAKRTKKKITIDNEEDAILI